MLATVKGDVHDIGKNLVDIILTNNGYTVVNLGIKQPVSAILDAAEEHDADVIGMSGLLVKSHGGHEGEPRGDELRGASRQRWPVMLGGAALTRAYVEQDLAELFDGRGPLRPRRLRGPAADGRRRWPSSAAIPGAELPALRERRVQAAVAPELDAEPEDMPARSDVAVDNPVPDAAVLGRPGRQGHPAGRLRRRTSTSGRRSWASGG